MAKTIQNIWTKLSFGYANNGGNLTGNKSNTYYVRAVIKFSI
jgi:hypothetical protein